MAASLIACALLAAAAAPTVANGPSSVSSGSSGSRESIDWLLAVGASYGAVLMGAGAGVLAGFWPRLSLPRWMLVYVTLLAMVMGIWRPADWTLSAWVLGLTTAVSGGAFGVLRWLVRRRRTR
ncbi:MAG: hypothetical protein J0L58_12965 [Burkholderiales bacterium]|uniref:hypothetical protein n=1 Tax=Inhella sp. TaxID=1921806 RepID=UPI001AC1F8F4|nr:hypothetical protein [Burkholderiales bacterium]